MNGVHDLGGMHGFGPVEPESNEPIFHTDWERRIFAIALSTMGARFFNTDEFRRTIERMPPARYLAATYYERWLYALEALLKEKGILSSSELSRLGEPSKTRLKPDNIAASGPHREAQIAEAGLSPVPRTAGSSEKAPPRPARFRPGERVVARMLNPPGHTRLPRYVRGRPGIIARDWGLFVFPDSHAHGLGANPQHCYAVEFTARNLWGENYPADQLVYVDLWEDYLAGC